MTTIIALLCFTATLFSPWVFADVIYKCKNSQGTVLYQEKPCTSASEAVSSWGAAGGGPLIIAQSNNGHYFVDGSINNQTLNFLIDTGASVVSVPLRLANSAGLLCHQQASMRTGNGTSNACITIIQKLKFGNFIFKDVEAIIAPNLEQPLLGMNVLKRFRVEQDNGSMRLIRRE